MKKRLISMLLTVLMVASLVGGMSVSAYADSTYETISYTIKDGDTLLKICNANGLNWYSCEAAIDKLNNLTSAKYKYLSVGSVIKLPASNEDATKIVSASTSTSTATTVVTTATGTSSSVVTSSAAANANVVYWLIPYTVQKGETVVGICNTLGISFTAYSDLIKSLNNISSWNKVTAGKTLYLPTTTTPAAGTTAYAVIAHSVTKGETSYSICQQYGTNYSSVTNLMAGLNPKVTLTNIKSGSTLLVPVSTTVTTGTTLGSASSSTTGTTVTGTTTTTTTTGTTGTTGTTNSSSNSTTKTYSLSSSVTGSGKVTFTVNGATVTSAAAGAKVYISAVPTADYAAVSSFSLSTSDGSTAPTVTDGYFTMPAANVTVKATYTTGYHVGVVNGNGTIVATVNGVEPVTVAKGVTVKVNVTANSGYTVDKIHVYKSGTGAEYATIKNGGTFTMPDCRVIVTADYTALKTYTLTTESNLNGSVNLQVGGSNVSKATAGDVVVIDANPIAGYELDLANTKAYIVKADGTAGEEVIINDYQFYMPAGNVIVKAAFKALEKDSYGITVKNVTDGHAYAYVLNDGAEKQVTSSKAGKTIYLKSDSTADGYSPLKYTLNANSAVQTIYPDADGVASFTMPAGSVVITPVFQGNSVTITEIVYNSDESVVKVLVNDAEVKVGDTIKVGDTVEVVASTKEPHQKIGDIIAYTSLDGAASAIDASKTFTVPNCDQISFNVSVVNSNVTLKGFDKVGDKVSYATLKKGGTDVIRGEATLSIGDTITMAAKCPDGYSITYTVSYTDMAGKTQTVTLAGNASEAAVDYTIPTCTDISIKMEGIANDNTLTVKDKTGTTTVTVNNSKLTDNKTEITVKTDATVTVTGSSKIVVTSDSADLKITKVSDTKYTFTMPTEDVTITVKDTVDNGVFVNNKTTASIKYSIAGGSEKSLAASKANQQISGFKENQEIKLTSKTAFAATVDGTEVTVEENNGVYSYTFSAPKSTERVDIVITTPVAPEATA